MKARWAPLEGEPVGVIFRLIWCPLGDWCLFDFEKLFDETQWTLMGEISGKLSPNFAPVCWESLSSGFDSSLITFQVQLKNRSERKSETIENVQKRGKLAVKSSLSGSVGQLVRSILLYNL